MNEETTFIGKVNIKFRIMVISKGEAGSRMREEAGIIGTVLFLKLMSAHFLIMLYNLHIHYIITYFLCNLGDDFPLDDDFGVLKKKYIYIISNY